MKYEVKTHIKSMWKDNEMNSIQTKSKCENPKSATCILFSYFPLQIWSYFALKGTISNSVPLYSKVNVWDNACQVRVKKIRNPTVVTNEPENDV